METICDYLVYDHQRCDALFSQVETSVASREWPRAEQSFQLFSSAVDRHIRTEEGILFPTFEKAIRGSGMPLGMLRVEHQRIRAIVGRLYDALCRSDPVDFMLHTETLALLMQQHNIKEEDMLYPLLDRILGSRTVEIVCAMREKLESTIQ